MNRLVECRAEVVAAKGRLVVCCDIAHFIPSGLTVAELFARLRPLLAEAMDDAAARGPGAVDVANSTSVNMNVGDADPTITLWVHNPARCLAALDSYLGEMEALTTRFVVGRRLEIQCSAAPA